MAAHYSSCAPFISPSPKAQAVIVKLSNGQSIESQWLIWWRVLEQSGSEIRKNKEYKEEWEF
ncbi:hypothetical protein PAAG_11220 [Paracoccidioides lutzii Pb01]|uniref:Uncharacterized protein n=1 Tax=Paracoccidioides lutzii (strain ATCC MYA-826 / Pb01) TaxID=502779 RepID=A0A0A2V6S1_PARBA|nr:hypothetical protein PAAG_11220 [Paracoccidioides lutzii Pb01]KGQ02042.1 hypothetical protein PAAG_11220 [Paracoccidioides lutzii Pb01]